MKLDPTRLAEALRAIHPQLTPTQATAVVEIARLAASADGRMDMAEMATIATVSHLVHEMSGTPDASVPSKQIGKDQLVSLAGQLDSTGPRELAYACAMLVMQTDDKVTDSEGALGRQLAELLHVDDARAHELTSKMHEVLGLG